MKESALAEQGRTEVGGDAAISSDLIPGTQVQARGLRWEVVLSQRMGAQTLLRLRGLDGAFLGREVDLLHPFEPITPILHDFQPARAAPLPNWLVYHQAFLLEQALGHDALLATQPGRLRIEPYQLVPVLRALRMSRPRILLADGVGLGKTIQAGLILTELMARRIAHRILIVSPAGPLLEQWRTELLDRFGLRATVIDRAKLDDIRRSAELGANPFDHVAVGVASVDFLKQEAVLEQLERATYDVVVIDEAHHCMDVGVAGDREDSLRRRMAEVLARRCDCLLLATATPHDGNDRSFASLCELLDYSLVDGRGGLRGQRYTAHVVRRLKDHIKDPATGQPMFRTRQVTPIRVSATGERFQAFRELQRSLVALVGPELQRALRGRRYHDVLSFIALLKRSVSSVAACKATLSVVAARYGALVAEREEAQDDARQRLRTLREYNRKLERYGTLTAEEETERDLLEAEDLAQSFARLQRELRSGGRQLRKFADLSEGLRDVLEQAGRALALDPKLEHVLAEIRAIRQQEPDANVLVYTEYTTTQDALVGHLRQTDIGEVLALSGDDDDAQRSRKTARFRSHPRLVMVSTDAAAEGLNLHQRCHHLLHVELPFNPNRLEQRNGRIDRYGQTKDPVVRYLYLANSFEERILLRLIAKYERQRSRLTFVPNTLGGLTSSDALTARLLQGLVEEEGWLLKEDGAPYFTMAEAAANDASDAATRDLLEEIDRSLAGFEKAARTHTWLAAAGMNAEQARVTEADRAMHRGQRESTVDLSRFVATAVQLDGGSVYGSPDDPFFSIELPPTWSHAAEDLPGYDPTSRRVWLTVSMDVTQTDKDVAVAFLGRGHPLVRRALDRVRHIAYGGEAGRSLDMRVSAVSAHVKQPGLLFTYLGRIVSQAGREYERVIAVRVPAPGQSEFLPDAAAWVEWIGGAAAIPTAGVWDRFFATGWSGVREQAARDAAQGFAPVAQSFAEARRRDIEQEREDLVRWLKQRAEDVTGTQVALAVQQSLFGGPAQPVGAAWQTLADPRERLAAFSADGAQPHARRHEAEGVLRLYRLCRNCGLRYDAQRPRCPRCHDEQLNQTHPAYAYGGFLARRDEMPVLSEEDRISARNNVRLYPQWDGDVVGRWVMDCGWGLALSRNERVLWMNEGPPPSAAELEKGAPRLHNDGKGFMVCGMCGNLLTIPQEQAGARGRRRAQQGQEDVFGHRRDCPQRGQPPAPVAIFADGFTEILRLVIPVPADLAAEKHEAWGLSLGYSLRVGIRQFYMLDGTEIDFEMEGPWGRTANGQTINYVGLSFIDATLGGTGYLPKVAADLNLVAKRSIAHLDHKNCDSACYRCLKTYANQRYHDKLQWPLAMPMLEALADQAPVAQRLELGDTHDPKPWLDAFAAGVGSPLELRFLRLFEQHGFQPEKQVPISVPDGTSPITVADFAVPASRLAIYVDGASIHAGHVLRRDRFIRGRLRDCAKPWKVVELRASDLRRGAELVQHLKAKA